MIEMSRMSLFKQAIVDIIKLRYDRCNIVKNGTQMLLDFDGILFTDDTACSSTSQNRRRNTL